MKKLLDSLTTMVMKTKMISLIFVVCEMVLEASSDTNMALSKTVSRSSPPIFGFPPDPEKYATDGDPTTRASTGQGMTAGWLSVDLVQPYQVTQISVTAPDDGTYATCQYGFQIGLTNTKPASSSPSYYTCATYIGPPIIPRAKYDITCSPNTQRYRYVVYQIFPSPTPCPASVMELEVYVVGKRISTYTANTGQRLTSSLMSSGTFSNVRRVTCMAFCQNNVGLCDSFNYRKSDSSCELNSHPSGPSSFDISNDGSWDWWTPTYEIFKL